jgi:predicted nucleic acid-binding protein
LLDTNTCVFIIRNKSQLALQRLRLHAAGVIGISSITLAELRFGADKSQDPAKNHAALNSFLAPLEVVEFDARAAGQYGNIRARHTDRRSRPESRPEFGHEQPPRIHARIGAISRRLDGPVNSRGSAGRTRGSSSIRYMLTAEPHLPGFRVAVAQIFA